MVFDGQQFLLAKSNIKAVRGMVMTLEVVVATMHQKDLSLYEKMNIKTDFTVANQCGKNETIVARINENNVKMISTDTVGVGINRNIGLLAATGDILLLSDDDVVYNDDYANKVLAAFENNPKADVIIFGMKITKNGKVHRIKQTKNQRLHTYNAMKYGACSIAIRRSALLSSRVSFSHLFGGGCKYSSGEDSLFILDCLRSGLKLYGNEYCLGLCAQDTSSWFNGYSDKYYYDKGAWFKAAYPRAFFLYKTLFCLRTAKKTGNKYKNVKGLFNAGYKEFVKLKSYDQWVEGN